MSKLLAESVEMGVYGCPFSPPLDAFGVPPISIRTSGNMNCYTDCPAGGGLIRLKLYQEFPALFVRQPQPIGLQPTPPYCWEI